jgi:hypothetical protein
MSGARGGPLGRLWGAIVRACDAIRGLRVARARLRAELADKDAAIRRLQTELDAMRKQVTKEGTRTDRRQGERWNRSLHGLNGLRGH